MSTRYTNDGKRKSSMTHANHGWSCPCGRTVYGNGGKASHRRACRVYKQHALDANRKALAEMDAGTWGQNLRPSLVAKFRQQYELEAERLEKELA